MKTITTILMFIVFSSHLFAQQWNGTASPTANINRDGNVAIGTTDASAKLVVRGAVKFQTLTLNNAAPRFLMMDTNGSLFYKDISSSLLNNCTTVNFLTKRDANGNLTCSTISQIDDKINMGDFTDYSFGNIDDNGVHIAARLSVHGTTYLNGNAYLFTQPADTDDKLLFFLNNRKTDDGSLWKMGSTVAQSGTYPKGKGFSFIEGATQQTRLFIQDMSGKVGIGTFNVSCSTCDDYLLFVKKGIKTERVKVEVASTAGWADYVFEKDYDLKTLDEVEAFIVENKHLPEIPSAKEVVENGIELGEMNKLLLQKIEELTLYMIEQNRVNEKQARQIEELKVLVGVKK